MSEDGQEISGGKGRRVQRRAAKGSCTSKPKRRGFTEARRRRFLNHFAASCNARAAARSVGISESCVDAWRKKDAQFNAGWKEALKLGYARLEAELVLGARKALEIRPRKDVAARVGAMSAETALKVLESYRRSEGRDVGTVWPHPYDAEAVRARLEAKMKALGIIEGNGGAAQAPLHDAPDGPRPPEGEEH